MLLIIEGKELLAEATGVFQTAEASRKRGRVLHCLELRLRERVVVGDVGTRMRPHDAQITQELRYRFGSHRPASVGMEGKRLVGNALFLCGFFDQLRRQML